jgi:hypothetical protein
MPSPLASAILQGTAAATPQQPFRASVAPTDVEKANADYNNAIQQTYAAQLGQQNAMWGGLAGLGSAGIMTLPKLLGGGASAGVAGGASGAAGTAAAAGAPLSLAAPVAGASLDDLALAALFV